MEIVDPLDREKAAKLFEEALASGWHNRFFRIQELVVSLGYECEFMMKRRPGAEEAYDVVGLTVSPRPPQEQDERDHRLHITPPKGSQ